MNHLKTLILLTQNFHWNNLSHKSYIVVSKVVNNLLLHVIGTSLVNLVLCVSCFSLVYDTEYTSSFDKKLCACCQLDVAAFIFLTWIFTFKSRSLDYFRPVMFPRVMTFLDDMLLKKFGYDLPVIIISFCGKFKYISLQLLPVSVVGQCFWCD